MVSGLCAHGKGAAAKAGITRVIGRDVKSSVRLVGDESVFLALGKSFAENWITERVRETYKILAPNSRIEVLGTIDGSTDERNQFLKNG